MTTANAPVQQEPDGSRHLQDVKEMASQNMAASQQVLNRLLALEERARQTVGVDEQQSQADDPQSGNAAMPNTLRDLHSCTDGTLQSCNRTLDRLEKIV